MEACKKPCNQCPFSTKSLAGWLGPYTSPIELHQIIMSEAPFTCHLVQGENEITASQVGTKEYPLCRGSLIYMKKNGKRPRNKELAKAIGTVQPVELRLVMDFPTFFKHHS